LGVGLRGHHHNAGGKHEKYHRYSGHVCMRLLLNNQVARCDSWVSRRPFRRAGTDRHDVFCPGLDEIALIADGIGHRPQAGSANSTANPPWPSGANGGDEPSPIPHLCAPVHQSLGALNRFPVVFAHKDLSGPRKAACIHRLKRYSGIAGLFGPPGCRGSIAPPPARRKLRMRPQAGLTVEINNATRPR
jgi:hypothetical protein